MQAKLLWLSEPDVESLLDPKILIDAIARGFRALQSGDMLEPAATTMAGLDDGAAYLTLFPAQDAETGLASAKILCGRPGNASENRPEIDAIVALADVRSGRLVALVSARMLTALRTAAVTTLAVRSVVGEKSWRIGLVGTGAQGRAHARVLAASGLAAEFLVASPFRGVERAESFAAEVAELTGVPCRALALGQIASECQVLVTASLSETPLPLGDLSGLRCLAAIGPFLPERHEIDPALLTRAALVVSDHPERLRRQWANAPERLDFAHVRPLSLTERIESRRELREGRLGIFLSDGRGFEDNVAARLVLEAARAAGRGVELT